MFVKESSFFIPSFLYAPSPPLKNPKSKISLFIYSFLCVSSKKKLFLNYFLLKPPELPRSTEIAPKFAKVESSSSWRDKFYSTASCIRDLTITVDYEILLPGRQLRQRSPQNVPDRGWQVRSVLGLRLNNTVQS